MASEFQVQYLDSENKLVKTVITSNSSSEVERSIKDLDGDVLSIVEKKSPSFNIQIGELVKLQEKTNFIQQLKTMLSSGVSFAWPRGFFSCSWINSHNPFFSRNLQLV